MKKDEIIILILIAAAIYELSKNKMIALPAIAPLPVTATTTTTGPQIDPKRVAIINYWKQTTSPTDQVLDNGRFQDIILNISQAEIDIIYDYVFNYLSQNIIPVTGTVFYNDITAIKNQYKIFL